MKRRLYLIRTKPLEAFGLMSGALISAALVQKFPIIAGVGFFVIVFSIIAFIVHIRK
jgi:hypothetical protein